MQGRGAVTREEEFNAENTEGTEGSQEAKKRRSDEG